MSDTAQAMALALRKLTAAVEGLGHKIVAIGAIAQYVRGSKGKVSTLDLLISSGPDQRDSVFSAARGEGLRQSQDHPLRLHYTAAKLDVTVDIDLVEASTPLHARTIERSEQADVLSTIMQVASSEDLIALGADHSVMVDLLRANTGKIDGAYLKQVSDEAGIFDKVKQAWQEARNPA